MKVLYLALVLAAVCCLGGCFLDRDDAESVIPAGITIEIPEGM